VLVNTLYFDFFIFFLPWAVPKTAHLRITFSVSLNLVRRKTFPRRPPSLNSGRYVRIDEGVFSTLFSPHLFLFFNNPLLFLISKCGHIVCLDGYVSLPPLFLRRFIFPISRLDCSAGTGLFSFPLSLPSLYLHLLLVPIPGSTSSSFSPGDPNWHDARPHSDPPRFFRELCSSSVVDPGFRPPSSFFPR